MVRRSDDPVRGFDHGLVEPPAPRRQVDQLRQGPAMSFITATSRPAFLLLRLLRLLRSGAVPMLSFVLLALVGVFWLLLGDRIVGVGALQSMAFQLPELGILSLAMMVALLSGGLNLSIIATANLCALTMAWVLTTQVPGAHGLMWGGWQVIAVLAGVAVAATVGLINGFVIAYLGVSPILATLGTMTMCKGLSIGITRGNVISGFPDPIVFLGNGTLAGVPVALLIFLALCVPIAVLLNKSPFGHKVYMIGSSEKATRYSGVDTKRVLLGVYVLSSLLAAVAALVMMARFNSANAAYGESYLLVTILAAVLGGVDPFGGFGKVGGLIMALILLQVISSAFNLLDFSPFLTVAIWGALIVVVTSLVVVLENIGASRRSM
jgi:simple sugar transport system permease protein